MRTMREINKIFTEKVEKFLFKEFKIINTKYGVFFRMKRSYESIHSGGTTAVPHTHNTPHTPHTLPIYKPQISFLNTKGNTTQSQQLQQSRQQSRQQLQQQSQQQSTIDWNAQPSYVPKTKSKMLLCSTLTKWTFVFRNGVPSLEQIAALFPR